jgi:CHAD domain-containing protein
MVKARHIEGLDCEASALDGALLVLRIRLDEMCALREQALDFSDIKGVHDMRVASRRLRSAVRDFLPFLPHRIPRKRLKALADALGDVRDEDVTIKLLAELRAVAEGEVAAGIERFADERRWRRERARTALEEALKEQAIITLREKFESSLEKQLKDAGEKTDGADQSQLGGLSFRQAGQQIILLRLDELRERSQSLYRPFETEMLHRLRIAAKRLRYAMELFAVCWSDELKEFAREVARLQKSLGELHDCDLLIAELSARLCGEDSISHTTHADVRAAQDPALIWLLQHFVQERIKHFVDALARWQQWETTTFLNRLSAWFETTSG